MEFPREKVDPNFPGSLRKGKGQPPEIGRLSRFQWYEQAPGCKSAGGIPER